MYSSYKSTFMKSIQENPRQNGLRQHPGTTSARSKSGHAMNLRDLLIDGLKDIYWAEKMLTKAIPMMVKNATSSELMDALKSHLEETKTHVSKLEEVFASLDENPVAKKCVAMEGLINEAEHIMEESEEGPVRDAGIISGAQKIEHYEIASYGTLSSFAKTIGAEEAASLLEEILAEEKEADEALSQIALASINLEATTTMEDLEESDFEDEDEMEDLYDMTEEDE